MNWDTVDTVDKFETYFYLGTQSDIEFELTPEINSNGKIVPGHKRTRLTSNFKVNPSDIKVASSTENDEELEKVWLIIKQSLNSFDTNSAARCLPFDIHQFLEFDEQYWRVTTDFSSEVHSKLNDWSAVCGKQGMEFWLKATITNVTAHPKVLPGNGKNLPPIWFERLHTIPSGSGLEFGSTAAEMIHEKELRERLERELPYEKDFRFRGDINFYLWVCRPKLMENEEEKVFPQVIRNVESVNLRLLKEKIHTDMWIVTDSGISIPFHKCFLAVRSPSIAAIFDETWTTTGSGEVTSNQLKVENASEEAVHAFLEYVYINDVSKAMAALPFALEILQRASKHNVSLLENEKEEFLQVNREVESVNLKLLKEKIHADMWIATDSGISIPCHKCFLAVSSPVIAAMFDERWSTTGSGEVTSNNLKLENVSEETVHAFLDYVYISDISKALESLYIAVELLQLANKYNVTLLEEKLLEYLYKKSENSEEWIPANLESLLKAYLFLEMSGICGLLEISIAKMLREKAGEILHTEEFLELQRDDMEASVKIRKCWETQRYSGIQSVFVKPLHLQLNSIEINFFPL